MGLSDMPTSRSYDVPTAIRLRPLLREIAKELDERYIAIRLLEVRLGRRDCSPASRASMVARLAEHRRGYRLAVGELEGLGCELDGGFPALIRVPAAAGHGREGLVVGSLGQGAVTERSVNFKAQLPGDLELPPGSTC